MYVYNRIHIIYIYIYIYIIYIIYIYIHSSCPLIIKEWASPATIFIYYFSRPLRPYGITLYPLVSWSFQGEGESDGSQFTQVNTGKFALERSPFSRSVFDSGIRVPVAKFFPFFFFFFFPQAKHRPIVVRITAAILLNALTNGGKW